MKIRIEDLGRRAVEAKQRGEASVLVDAEALVEVLDQRLDLLAALREEAECGLCCCVDCDEGEVCSHCHSVAAVARASRP